MTPPTQKQTQIEDFMSKGSVQADAAAAGGNGGTASEPAPLPLPYKEPAVHLHPKLVLGRPVIKDFLGDEGDPASVRPFKGYVADYDSRHKCFNVLYEDGDTEGVYWAELRPLILRGEKAGLPRVPLPACKTTEKGGSTGGSASASATAAAAGKSKRSTSPSAAAAAAAPAQGGTPGRIAGGGAGSCTQQLAASATGSQQYAAQAKKRGQASGAQQEQQQEQQQQQPGQAAAAPQKGAVKGKQAQVAGAKASSSKAQRESAPAGKEEGAAAKPKKQPKQSAADAPAAAKPEKQPKQGAADGPAAAKPKKQPKQADASGESSSAGKKRKQAGGEAAGAQPGKRQRASEAPAVELPVVKIGEEHVYEYKRGEEPWRRIPGFKHAVHDEVDLSAEAVKRIRTVQRDFNKLFIQAEVDEDVRVTAALEEIAKLAAKGKLGKEVKRPSRRPDRVAESRYKDKRGLTGKPGKKVQEVLKVAGQFPGWNIGNRAYSRAELSCIGFHRMPIAGIDFVGQGQAYKGAPSFATSVMVSGWYQDDKDEGGEMWYTGEGGNDLLHGRNQVKDQKLERGNAGLVGNIQLGIPVRVTRKQEDSHGHFGVAFTYDGLYDVLSYRFGKGQEGKWVYQFRMRRRPDQGPLLSQRVTWGGISAKRDMVPKNRQGVVVLDISGGQEKSPIAAIDDTWLCNQTSDTQPHGDIPCCSALGDVVREEELVGKVLRGINQERVSQLVAAGYEPSVRYITRYEFVGKAEQAVAGLKAAELPQQYEGNPHAYLQKLNHGHVPYNARGQLFHTQPVVYECGPWAQCKHGDQCPQAVTQRGTKWRLEVYKTSTGCGWGVRSLDTIPQHAFICLYVGQVYDAAEHEELVRTVEEQDAEYTFDAACRDDTNWDGSEKAEGQQDKSHRAHYVICGLRKRNVGAWLNHSCAPNCFVQPVLSAHHDTRMPAIAIFAMENITPLTELTMDYGEAYTAGFQGGCKCGAADCVSTRAAAAAGGAQVPRAEEAGDGSGEEGEEEGDEGSGRE